MTRLVTSPSGRVFWDSPLLYFLLGAGALVWLLQALKTGKPSVARSDGPRYFRSTPVFFASAWLFHLSLAAMFTRLGLLRWRAHSA